MKHTGNRIRETHHMPVESNKRLRYDVMYQVWVFTITGTWHHDNILLRLPLSHNLHHTLHARCKRMTRRRLHFVRYTVCRSNQSDTISSIQSEYLMSVRSPYSVVDTLYLYISAYGSILCVCRKSYSIACDLRYSVDIMAIWRATEKKLHVLACNKRWYYRAVRVPRVRALIMLRP